MRAALVAAVLLVPAAALPPGSGLGLAALVGLLSGLLAACVVILTDR